MVLVGMAATAGILAVPGQAHATLAAIMPMTLLAAGAASCGATPPPGPLAGQDAALAKSAAILGGSPSMLDQIRMQQARSETVSLSAKQAMTDGGRLLQPALGGTQLPSATCTIAPVTNLAMPSPALGISGSLRAVSDPENFLASKRVPVRRTPFDGDWARVRLQPVSAGTARAFAGGRRADRLSLIEAVNRSVNRKIRYVEDSQLFGRADYWAGARTTLRLGKGDCEDIALTKMQLLAASGLARKDMILTIARDLVRNADHAILIVHHEGRYLVLDNSTDTLLDASSSHDYRPIMSFGENTAWLHGY